MPRLLVITPNWIGDCVAAQPLFARLKAARPDVEIDALAPAWVAPVLEAMAEIRRSLINPFGHGSFAPAARWKLARSLAAQYDEAYVLPNSWKSALIPFMAGIPLRIGFTGEARYGLLNRRHELDTQALPLQVERYAMLAQAPGSTLSRPLAPPRLQQSATQIRTTLAELGLHEAERPVVFCPGAEYGPAKRWPQKHFATLARSLLAQGHAVWLLGSKKDAAVAQEICRLAGAGVRDLCGNTNLAQAVSLIAHARLVVSNDSGLMHVAAALDTPQIALFGSSSPEYTPPLSARAQVLWLKPDCGPCFKRECPLGHLKCLNDITPESVLQSAASVLQA